MMDGRSIQKLQQGPGYEWPDNHDYQRCECCQVIQVPMVRDRFCPGLLRHNTGETMIPAPTEIPKKRIELIEDWACAAYSGKSIIPDKTAHDDGVSRVVKLLSHISDEHWNREFNDAVSMGSPSVISHRANSDLDCVAAIAYLLSFHIL